MNSVYTWTERFKAVTKHLSDISLWVIRIWLAQEFLYASYQKLSGGVIPPKRAASKSRINTSPAFSAGRVSLLKPSYAFALE